MWFGILHQEALFPKCGIATCEQGNEGIGRSLGASPAGCRSNSAFFFRDETLAVAPCEAQPMEQLRPSSSAEEREVWERAIDEAIDAKVDALNPKFQTDPTP